MSTTIFKEDEKMKNVDIRQEAMEANVRLWQIADKLGVNDCNFSRKLRKELSVEEKTKIRAIISELSAKK